MNYGGCVYHNKSKQYSFIRMGYVRTESMKYGNKKKYYPKTFSTKYNCNKIVWFECFSRIEETIDPASFKKCLFELVVK
jgi:putative endonuclease